MNAFRLLLRPVGYLLFVVSLAALSGAARLLGESHELGFFSGRLAGMLWRYPEVTRRGVQMAWLAWAALFAVAVSPIDPIASAWDEVGLAALALLGVWHWVAAGQRAEH
jgi:hypothetical protein